MYIAVYYFNSKLCGGCMPKFKIWVKSMSIDVIVVIMLVSVVSPAIEYLIFYAHKDYSVIQAIKEHTVVEII